MFFGLWGGGKSSAMAFELNGLFYKLFLDKIGDVCYYGHAIWEVVSSSIKRKAERERRGF